MSTSSRQDTFPFLSLPPELRQKIYGFCPPEGYRFNIYPWPEAPDEGVTLKNYEDSKNTIPQLLRTCRQIYHEAKAFPYRNAVFEIDVHLNTQWHKLPLFEPESQNEIRHMSLNIIDGYTRDFYPENPGNPESIDKTWIDLIGRLSTLKLMIHHPSVEFCLNYGLDELQDDPEWNDLLKQRLQAINRLASKETKIMVDVNGEDMVLKLVEEAMPNRCIFGNLEAGDSRFDRGFHKRPKYNPADYEIDDDEESIPEWDYD